ncbi:hypothetical protein [Eubacterium maltosivorans]|uniref:hypothetical protein n=1 Tax=Eubacterium maltosivorans TaxID=2041044 RepID=UPI003A946001
MAIGDTSTIKDANGVSITIKDVAAEYLIEQLNGTFNRENFRTDESMIFGWNQKDVDYGSYRVFPGGWVLFEVWAYLHFNVNVEATARVKPPLAFSKPPVAMACSKYWNSTGAWGYMANVSAKIDTNNDIIIGGYQINGSSNSDALAVQIIGIGRV